MARAVAMRSVMHFNMSRGAFRDPEDSLRRFNLPPGLKSIKHVHSNLKMLKPERRSERGEVNNHWQ
jgi:hypothetical protein